MKEGEKEEIEEIENQKINEKKEADNSIISFKSDHENDNNATLGEKIITFCYPNAKKSSERNSFPLKFFSCCLSAPPEESEISVFDTNMNETYNNNEIFPEECKRKDEIQLEKKFDKTSIIQLTEVLSQDTKFMRKFEKYEKLNKSNISDKFCLKMFMKDQNEFSSAIPVTRCQIEIPFNLFTQVPSVEKVGYAIISPDERTIWDHHFKEYKILHNLKGNSEIIQIITEKEMEILIPREFLEKRTHFIENGVFYSYSSSIPDNLLPPKKEPIRSMNYFGIFKVENDGQNILIDGFYQIDIKVGQPGPLIFMSLPKKMMNFTIDLIKYLNNED